MHRVLYWLTNQSFNRVLENLWGIEARLYNHRRPSGIVRRPQDFRVVEPHPIKAREKPGVATYLVYRVGLDTRAVGRLLARTLGAKSYAVSGLKDACARVYQYITVINPVIAKEEVTTDRFKAWLVSRNTLVWPGSHEYNMFKVVIHTSEPRRVCNNAKQSPYIPGFFGPQRFGIERPNTHYIGLLYTDNMKGYIIREYTYRYPLEERSTLGTYEKRTLKLVEKTRDPWRIKVQRIMLEALQAYIYNRALSKTLHSISEVAEHHTIVTCGSMQARVPAVRLPSPRLAKSRSKWAKIVANVLEEEGISWQNLKGLKPVFRPLIYPVCRLKCIQTENITKISFNLPRGAYATTLLIEIADIDWLEYSHCHTK